MSESVVVVPDGGVDVIWTAGRLPWVAGPDTRTSLSSVARGSFVVGARLAPGAISSVIGASATAILDQRIDLDAVVSASVARRTSDRVHAAPQTDASSVLAEAVEDLVGVDWEPDPIVQREIERIHTRCSPTSPESSRRHVRRRFTDAMGYGPKFYERILRVERFSTLVAADPSISLAQAAVLAGFHDQAHLSRDTRQLTGETPAALARRSRRSIQ